MVIHRVIHRRRFLRRLAGGSVALAPFINGLTIREAHGASHARKTAMPPLAWPPLIVVDPGHGGYDAGTTGKAGTLEKDVTLATGLALKASLSALGPFQVAMTRTHDAHLPLENRAAIAHDLGASLLISLHANAFADPDVRGASVYTLARHASDRETEALARTENRPAVDRHTTRPGLPMEVSDILSSLASREARADAARLAHEIAAGLGRDLPMLPSPERRADFTVLHAPEVPSLLVEMGFLSNPRDEAALSDSAHQALIAKAITQAIQSWFARKTPA